MGEIKLVLLKDGKCHDEQKDFMRETESRSERSIKFSRRDETCDVFTDKQELIRRWKWVVGLELGISGQGSNTPYTWERICCS